MARLPRLCIPGWPHLVMQSGHSGQLVFRDPADGQLFRQLLQQYAAEFSTSVHAYGLFASEVRLLVTPGASDSLSAMMQAIGRRYGAAHNKRYGRRGGLWEGRFRATVIDPATYLLPAMQFTEGLGPAGEHGALEPVSTSAAHHLGSARDALVNDHLVYWSLGNTPFEREVVYRRAVEQEVVNTAEIARAVSSGWPLGSDAFIDQLQLVTERRLRERKAGRPPSVKPVPN